MMNKSLWFGNESLWRRWWPALLGPAVVVLISVLHANGMRFGESKMILERIAYGCIGGAVLAHLYRYLRNRMEVHLLLLVLAAEFLHREFGHQPWVYVVLVLVCIWGVVRFKNLLPQFELGRMWPWIICTGWTYFLSQLIARRALRIIPIERALHVPWEETLENLAHLMLLVTAFADWMVPRKANCPSDEGTHPQASDDPQ